MMMSNAAAEKPRAAAAGGDITCFCFVCSFLNPYSLSISDEMLVECARIVSTAWKFCLQTLEVRRRS
jgi:hypothetical protein